MDIGCGIVKGQYRLISRAADFKRQGLAVAVIRTALVTIPPILGDIIKTLLTELDVVAQLDDRAEVEKQLRLSFPDLVIIGLLKGETDAIGYAFLDLVPVANVIVLSNDGRNAYVYATHARRMVLTDVSPRALIDVILGAATD
jgi:DNA-binding NarL/FixJ family response regulator